MEFKHAFEIPLAREALWDKLMDVHEVAACIEGVHDLQIKDPDHFEGKLAVKMGPMRLSFKGNVEVTRRDRSNWNAAFIASANDRKVGGGFNSELAMQLHESGPQSTMLDLTLTTSLTGRIGQLGRPLIKKRVQNMLEDFAVTLSERGTTVDPATV